MVNDHLSSLVIGNFWSFDTNCIQHITLHHIYVDTDWGKQNYRKRHRDFVNWILFSFSLSLTLFHLIFVYLFGIRFSKTFLFFLFLFWRLTGRWQWRRKASRPATESCHRRERRRKMVPIVAMDLVEMDMPDWLVATTAPVFFRCPTVSSRLTIITNLARSLPDRYRPLWTRCPPWAPWTIICITPPRHLGLWIIWTWIWTWIWAWIWIWIWTCPFRWPARRSLGPPPLWHITCRATPPDIIPLPAFQDCRYLQLGQCWALLVSTAWLAPWLDSIVNGCKQYESLGHTGPFDDLTFNIIQPPPPSPNTSPLNTKQIYSLFPLFCYLISFR